MVKLPGSLLPLSWTTMVSFSLRFLEIATDEDVKDALTTRTAMQLVEICQPQSLKVFSPSLQW